MSVRECLEEMLEVIGRKRLLVPAPWALAYAKAWFLEKLPGALLTTDQVTLLKTDNVVSQEAEKAGRTLRGLGIQPESTASVLPSYLWRYRAAGQFTKADA